MKIRERITKRLQERLDQGMIQEVEKLLKRGITHERLERFGLEYRFISRYLLEQITREEMIENLKDGHMIKTMVTEHEHILEMLDELQKIAHQLSRDDKKSGILGAVAALIMPVAAAGFLFSMDLI